MAAQVPSSDLSARILALESALRALTTGAAGNPADPTSRVAALEGRATTDEAAISGLQGSVSTLQGRNSPGATGYAYDNTAVRVNAVANSAATTAWTAANTAPAVDVQLTSPGRLLVRWGAQQELYAGGSSVTAFGWVGYRIIGGVADQASLATAPEILAPDYAKALSFKDKGGANDNYSSGSMFDVTGVLAAGWYRISLAQSFQYNSTATAGYQIVNMRSIAATIL